MYRKVYDDDGTTTGYRTMKVRVVGGLDFGTGGKAVYGKAGDVQAGRSRCR